jgi:Heavy metal binding domain
MQQYIDHDHQDRFPRDPSGLPEASSHEVLELAELGLYGNIVVVPAERDYWPPADLNARLSTYSSRNRANSRCSTTLPIGPIGSLASTCRMSPGDGRLRGHSLSSGPHDPSAMPERAGPVTFACPMHPEVTSDQPGRCPERGMKLLAVGPASQPIANHAATHDDDAGMHHDEAVMYHHQAGMHHDMAAGKDSEVSWHGIEWEYDIESIGSVRPRPCTGDSSIAPLGSTARQSTGGSASDSGSRSG